MRTGDLEAWVLGVVDRVESGKPVEDSRVELKREWPTEANKAARRIAGHANASQGESILWIIGLDEADGVVSFAPMKPDQWLTQIRREFDEEVPSATELVVPTSKGEVVALLFETDRAPYLVRNEAYGKPGGGPIAWEVPWRTNSMVRSASRADLLRILSPIAHTATIDVLDARLEIHYSPGELPDGGGYEPTVDEMNPHLFWKLSSKLYISPMDGASLVLPKHLCSASLIVGDRKVRFTNLRLDAPGKFVGAVWQKQSVSVESTAYETIIDGPGVVALEAGKLTNDNLIIPEVPRSACHLRLQSARKDMLADVTIPLQYMGIRTEEHQGEDYTFGYYRLDKQSRTGSTKS